jgi:CheY-like chemotaxis protein
MAKQTNIDSTNAGPTGIESAGGIEASGTWQDDRLQEALRVLIVDDNADVSAAMGMLLRLLGHSVSIAGNGEEALSLAATDAPRIAFLDIGLPDMDGLELARRLRHRFPSKTQLLLVAVTGYDQEQDRRDAMAAGFDELLPKPVGRDVIDALLQGVR